MGCDIHILAERKVGSAYEAITDAKFAEGPAPFDWRAYGMFGFLAGVRNYSDVPPIAERRGFPEDASKIVADEYDEWAGDAHSPSWLSVAELTAFDYDKPMEDRRVTRQLGPNLWSGACTAEAGFGEMTTYRDFLGPQFFADLSVLEDVGADRVVFWFDN